MKGDRAMTTQSKAQSKAAHSSQARQSHTPGPCDPTRCSEFIGHERHDHGWSVGPQFVVGKMERGYRISSGGPNAQTVAFVATLPDARLIAAAPRMYELLKQLEYGDAGPAVRAILRDVDGAS